MRILLAIFSVIVIGTMFYNSNAFAQEGTAPGLNTSDTCTTPVPNDPVAATDERWVYCDIHMRQFAHREKMLELRGMLDERAKNYKASTYDVRQNYQQALQKHHESLGEVTPSEENSAE